MISKAVTVTTEYQIYVGVPRQLTADHAMEFAGHYFECGMTMVEAKGVWPGPDGLEEETSLVITILGDGPDMSEKVGAFADAYAQEFDQAQVIWTTTTRLLHSKEYHP